MHFKLRLVASADDRPEMPGMIRAAIEEAGGRVETVGTDRAEAGAVELTFELRLDRSHLMHGIIGAVEKLPCVAVMRVTDPRSIGNVSRD
jgi:hypothetical protein